jgi:hypothetical protein
MFPISDCSSDFKNGLLSDNDEFIKNICQKHKPQHTFSKVDHLLLGLPILETYFSSQDLSGISADFSNSECLSISMFTPDNNFEFSLPSLSLNENNEHCLLGSVRVPKPVGKYLLVLLKIEEENKFALLELEEVHKKSKPKDYDRPSFKWINFDEGNTKILALSTSPVDDISDHWLSILSDYGHAQATVCLQYIRQEISKMRVLLDQMSNSNNDFANSQVLSISKLSAVELNANIAQVYLEQFKKLGEPLQTTDGLVALHLMNTLYSEVLHLSIDIHNQIGSNDNDMIYNSAEFCAGGQLMSGMLVSNHVVNQLRK